MLTASMILAEIDADQMIDIFIHLAVVGAIVWLVLWAAAYIGIPEPFGKIIKAVVVIFAVAYLARLLIGLT